MRWKGSEANGNSIWRGATTCGDSPLASSRLLKKTRRRKRSAKRPCENRAEITAARNHSVRRNRLSLASERSGAGLMQLLLLGFDLRDQPPDVLGAEAFGAGDLLVIDLFPVLQRAEAISLDAAEVDKHILTILIQDEAEPLFGIKPLDGTDGHGRPPS